MNLILKNKKGQSAIEFAIILPFMLLILFSIIIFGSLIYDKTIVTMAANKGLDAGLGSRNLDVSGEEATNNVYLQKKAAEDQALSMLKFTMFTETYSVKYINYNDERIEMNISCKFNCPLPFVNSLFEKGENISAKTVYKENKPFKK